MSRETANSRRWAPGGRCRRRLAAVSVLSLIAAGCGTTPSLAATAESEAIRQIQSIALPPVILPGGVSNDGVTRAAFEQLTLSLALKGYVMHRVDSLVLDAGVDPAKLRELSPAALSELLPAGNSHYLLCWIDETPASGGSGAKAGSLRVSAALVDRSGQRILWQNHAYHHSADPLQAEFAAFFGALMMELASPYPAFYTPIMRQTEFDNRMSLIADSNKLIAGLVPPVVIAIRALLSTFPERPMR